MAVIHSQGARRPGLPSTIASALLLVVGSLACAQSTAPAATTAAKPAAATAPKPVSGSAPTKSAAAVAAPRPAATPQGGLASGERLMTRDELRVCLKRSDDLVARRDELERIEPTFESERKILEVEGEGLSKEKETLRQYTEQRQNEFKARADALTTRVNTFRERTAADGSGRGRVQSRSELAEIERERVSLETDIKALNADRDVLIKDLEKRTQEYNLRVEGRDGRAAAWREKVRQHKEAVTRHESEGDLWRKECGNRPYREDDERAIRSGK